MSASHVESWLDERNRMHQFQGAISCKDLAMDAGEVIARVRNQLVESIVNRMMEEIGPRIDEAIRQSWQKDPT